VERGEEKTFNSPEGKEREGQRKETDLPILI